jgi:MFS family permease
MNKIKNKKETYSKQSQDRAINLIVFLGFIFGLSISLLAYIASSYFKQVVHGDNISIFYIVAFSIILVGLFKLNKLIEGFGRARTLMSLLAAQIGVLFTLQFVDVSIGGAILLMSYYILYSIIWVVFDIVLEAYSTDDKTGHIRGLFLSVSNMGILVGPILSMYLLENYGFDIIFMATMMLYVVIFVAVLIALNNIKGHVIKKNLSIRQTLSKFKHNSKLLKAYWMSFTLRFFYAVMTVYMPLFLREIGMSWGEIGVVFTVMLIPFVIVEYPAGVLADEKYGEKEMLIIGMLIVIASVISMLFIEKSTVFVWMGVLFASRVGAALLESMQDSYFYKQIDGNNVAIINAFRSTRAVAYVSSAIIMGVSLLFFDNLQVMFIVLIVVMVVGLYPIITLEDTK